MHYQIRYQYSDLLYCFAVLIHTHITLQSEQTIIYFSRTLFSLLSLLRDFIFSVSFAVPFSVIMNSSPLLKKILLVKWNV